MVNNFWITTGIFFFSSACSHWLLQGHVTPRLQNSGRFPYSTKLFEIWKQEQVVQKFSEKSFQKFTKLLNFRNVNHSTENCTNFRERKVEWKENFWKKFFENLGILHEVVLFFGNCGKCRFIRYCKLNDNLNRTFWLNGKYPLFFPQTRLFKVWSTQLFCKARDWLDYLRVLYLLKSTSRYPSMDGTVSKFWRLLTTWCSGYYIF